MENKEKKEMLKIKMSTMQRQFRYNQQGYSLIKCMVLRFSLLSIHKNLLSIRECDGNVVKYFSYLRDNVQDNLESISKELGSQFRDLVLDCIVSFSAYNEKDSGFEQALYIMEELTLQEIKDFIINGVQNFTYRDNCGTPISLCELVEKLFNANGRVVVADYGCANGDFLVNYAKNNPNNKYLGYEINYDAKLLAKIRLTFLNVDNVIQEENILKNNNFMKADFIFSEPPFGMKIGNIFRADYERAQITSLNLRLTQTSEWMFIDKILSNLNKNGKGIIVVPEGILTNQFDIEQRRYLVEHNSIETVIKLPNSFFQTTSISTSLLILSNNKPNNNYKFIDASEMYCEQGRTKTLLVDEIIKSYKNDSNVVSLEKIRENNYVLSANRYKSLKDLKIENPVKLSELVEDIFRGPQISADILNKYSTSEKSNDVYKIVSSGDIVNGMFDTNKLEKIKIQKNYDRYLLQNNDLLISCKSTKVKTSIVEIGEGERIIPSGSIIVVRCKTQRLNPVYLKMFFDSNVGIKLLASIQTGTIIISINPTALEIIDIACLPIEKQNKLANKYLSTLDMLKLERKKIETLENKLATMLDEDMED